MTDAHHSENDSDDETLREQYLAQFDDPERHRTEQARTSVLQLRLDNEEEFGGGRA